MGFQFPKIVFEKENSILDAWLGEQLSARSMRRDLINESTRRAQYKEFLDSFLLVLRSDFSLNINDEHWKSTRVIIDEIARARARLGFSPTETAIFVFSLKSILFRELKSSLKPEDLIGEIWALTEILDKLGLYSIEAFQKGREEVIRRQQAEMLELSTPVVELAEAVIALPLIGTLDSHRAQTVMEVLLQSIVTSHADIAIIDITGVPTVDTLVAQHLIKTVAAARLMGADCIISGIRPQIAQTIVQLGIDLGHIHTKASLADAFRLALKQRGYSVSKIAKVGAK